LTTCPECGEGAYRKRITGTAVIFKGSGFYSTDRPKNSPKPDNWKPPTGGTKRAIPPGTNREAALDRLNDEGKL
jgi:hypothetical protein